jgi:hypothetical protein
MTNEQLLAEVEEILRTMPPEDEFEKDNVGQHGARCARCDSAKVVTSTTGLRRSRVMGDRIHSFCQGINAPGLPIEHSRFGSGEAKPLPPDLASPPLEGDSESNLAGALFRPLEVARERYGL